jgi:integrase
MIDKLVGNGYSGSMVRSCVSSASAMFSHGVRITGALPRNPVRDLERGDLPSAKRKTEPRYLSLDEVQRLLRKMSDEFRPVAAACFWGALRVSEALSLRWGHIDFEAGTIDVPGTKSEASAATIRLHPELAKELKKLRERSARRGFDRIAPSALVFQTMTGLSPGRRNVHRAVSRAAENAGLVPEGAEPVGVHDLRHSFAAYALTDARMSMLETSHLLRHANPQVTATVYAGMSEDAKAASWDKLVAVANE